MLADLERQGEEGGRGVHINERAKSPDNRSMMGSRSFHCQIVCLAERRDQWSLDLSVGCCVFLFIFATLEGTNDSGIQGDDAMLRL